MNTYNHDHQARAKQILNTAKAENAEADRLEAQAAKQPSATTRHALRNRARRHREEALQLLQEAERELGDTPTNRPDPARPEPHAPTQTPPPTTNPERTPENQ